MEGCLICEEADGTDPIVHEVACFLKAFLTGSWSSFSKLATIET